MAKLETWLAIKFCSLKGELVKMETFVTNLFYVWLLVNLCGHTPYFKKKNPTYVIKPSYIH